MKTSGDVVWFRRCPASYVTPFTQLMVRWYLWLQEWSKTPLDFGLSVDELDPRYLVAMEVMRRERARLEMEELERIRKEV